MVVRFTCDFRSRELPNETFGPFELAEKMAHGKKKIKKHLNVVVKQINSSLRSEPKKITWLYLTHCLTPPP